MKKENSNAKKLVSKNYHNTLLLMKNYRDVVWSLELSTAQAKIDFESEYEMSIADYLEDTYAAGADFAGTKLEHQANCIKRTHEMLKLIDKAVSLIREKHKNGENFFWILYYSYLCPQQLTSIEEILDRLKMHMTHITRDMYFAQRSAAIDTLSSILWGFTAREFMPTISFFEVN